MAAFGRELTPAVMDEAAAGIARGEHADQLIERLGISTRTLRRWKTKPEFADRVATLRTDLLKKAMGRVSAFSVEAAVKLGKLLNSSNEMVVLAAARTLLQSAGGLYEKVRRVDDDDEKAAIMGRLEALEKSNESRKRA